MYQNENVFYICRMCSLYVWLIRMRGVLVQLASGVFEETFEARVTAAQLAAAAFDGVCVFIITAVPLQRECVVYWYSIQ